MHGVSSRKYYSNTQILHLRISCPDYVHGSCNTDSRITYIPPLKIVQLLREVLTRRPSSCGTSCLDLGTFRVQHEQRSASDQDGQTDKIEEWYEEGQKGGGAKPEHEPAVLPDEVPPLRKAEVAVVHGKAGIFKG